MLKVPFWNDKQNAYGFKIRPAALYNFIGCDAVFLPIIGLEKEDGTPKRAVDPEVEVPIRLRKTSVSENESSVYRHFFLWLN